MPVKTYDFDSLAERDKWLNENYPQRTCEDAPGCYTTPDGTSIYVRFEKVTVYPQCPKPFKHHTPDPRD